MTLPGHTLTRDDNSPPVGPSASLATAFVACETQRAPDGVSSLRSMRDYARICGDRTLDTQAGYDWLDTHFHEGGAAVYLTSMRGAAAARAFVVLNTAAVPALVSGTVRWQVPGAYGNRAALDVDAGAAAGTFVLRVLVDGLLVKTSPELGDMTAAQAWAASPAGAGLIVVEPGAGADPAPIVAPLVLAGGDDDFDGITTATLAAALARFTSTYGPGKVVLPGRTSLPAHQAVADSLIASKVNRVASLAMPDVDAATVAAQATTFRTHDAANMVDLLAGRLEIPGITASTQRSTTLDALRSGREGANDAAGVTPNQPAAGEWGKAAWATGLTQRGSREPWTDEEIELLYDAGVNVAVVDRGQIKLYGSRTAVNVQANPAGFRIGSARLRMALTELLDYEVGLVQFAELDPQGIRLKDLQGTIESRVDTYPTSVHSFRAVTEVQPGELPGTAVLYAAIEDLKVSYDAEVIHARISRTVTEV